MSDYIKREDAKRGLCEWATNLLDPRFLIKDDAMCVLDNIPAAEVAPVVHGRWISDGDGYHWTYNCSICAWKDGYPFNERHNFCPNCGARMDGGDTNA